MDHQYLCVYSPVSRLIFINLDHQIIFSLSSYWCACPSISLGLCLFGSMFLMTLLLCLTLSFILHLSPYLRFFIDFCLSYCLILSSYLFAFILGQIMFLYFLKMWLLDTFNSSSETKTLHCLVPSVSDFLTLFISHCLLPNIFVHVTLFFPLSYKLLQTFSHCLLHLSFSISRSLLAL